MSDIPAVVSTPDSFRRSCSLLGIDVSDKALSLLQAYADQLLDWNTRINLISRKDTGDIWRRHLLHSAAVLSLVKLPGDGRYFDLGTGGGLPGIVLAILLPEARFTLCDATGKKIRAVEEMACALGLGNVRCLHSRAEDLAEDREFAGRYHAVFARAVSQLELLVNWGRPLLSHSGPRTLIAWKGGTLSEEIRAAKKIMHGGRIEEIPVSVPDDPWFSEQEKKIVVVHP